MAEVQLPQLGESVTEGVITRWLVAVGDTVEVDQPLAEISTDKVDTEIPSPVAGTVTELRFDVDDTVEVGQTIAVVGDDDADDAGDADETKGDADDAGDADETKGDADDASDDDADETGDDASDQTADTDAPAPASPSRADTGPQTGEPAASDGGGDGQRPALTSPLVRRLLREAGIDPAAVRGTGKGGRITREDAERAIAAGPAPSADGGALPGQASAQRERPPASPTQVDFGGERELTQDLSRIRKVIARSMMESLHNTAQLTAAVEADVTAIMHLRDRVKDEFKAREGVSLSPLAMIARAVCMTLPRHPALNAAIDQEAGTAKYHSYVNLGIAVDTERGLLVPNIKDAQDLSTVGMARAIADLAKRARDKKLGPDEISGGTFTITNTGSMGTLFDTPVLNPPEVAILATPTIEKRPVVVSDGVSDAIAIRWMTYLCLTYDHRMVDGADAARFLQDLTYMLETHDFGGELGG